MSAADTNSTSVITSTTSDTSISTSTTLITTTPPITTTSTTSTSSTTSDTSTSTTSSSSSSSSRSIISTTSSTSSSTSSTLSTTSTPAVTAKTSTTVVTAPNGETSTVTQTITTPIVQSSTSNTATGAASSSTSSASAVGSAGSQNGGSSSSPPANVVAPAVIVPVIVIALAVFLGIFLWRRKQRREAAEMRQKEMEEYSYNPNSDPTIPVVGTAVSSSGEDQNGEGGGYRGWGTTSSSGPRKASTTLGGTSTAGAIGIARSDSGGRGYDDQSTHALSPERNGPANTESHEGLGVLGTGPLAGNNRNQGVNRGISNASSAYSGGQRSNGSDNTPVGFAGSPQQYYDEIMQPNDADHDGYGQPVIRDVSARRNTRIENPAIYPQHGNAGISQNF